jgi:uncharacterized lipoprotein YajG
MNRFLKIIVIFYASAFLFSCSKTKESPLILPPNFAEMPDLNNLEKNSSENIKEKQQQDVEKLKELLLKSD